jgi:hypothetical protein
MRALILILAATPLLAQQWSAPRLGYLYDADSRSLRAIAGVPGSASLESPLAVSMKLSRAFVAPNRDYAIAQNTESENLFVVTDSGEMKTLEGSPASADVVAYTSTGSIAAVYSQGRLQVWRNLPGSPELVRNVETADVRQLAVSDDGAVVAAVTEAGAVILGDDTRTPLSIAAVRAISFLPNGHDLAIAEAESIQLIRSVDTEPEMSQLASAADGVAEPAALAVSADGRTLLVANTREASVLSIELESRSVKRIECESTPEGLFRLRGNAVFRLTGMSGEAVSVYDGDAEEPRVFSIPTGVSR